MLTNPSHWRPWQRLAYGCITSVALPFAMLRLLWKSRQHPGYVRLWWHRLGWTPKLEACIWIHAVSVGEIINAITLLKALQHQHPDTPFLITTSTPTGLDRLLALAPNDVTKAYFPYDTRGGMKRFVTRSQPKVAILIETEIWPHCLERLHQANIPCCIVNARMSAQSFRGYARLTPWLSQLLQQMNWIGAQTNLDAKRFARLGGWANVQMMGNLKCDRALDPTWIPSAHDWRSQLGNRLVWIAASTHPGEEEACLQAHQRIRQDVPNACLILIPRHPFRCQDIASLESMNGFEVTHWSQQPPHEHTDVWLIDTLGQLPMLYGAGDMAWIGGSWANVGGHNPVEPALLGTAIITGPHTFNFKLLYRQLRRAHACLEVSDPDELASTVLELHQSPDKRQALALQASRVLAHSRGALERYCQRIKTMF